jgi:hypothetical protein
LLLLLLLLLPPPPKEGSRALNKRLSTRFTTLEANGATASKVTFARQPGGRVLKTSVRKRRTLGRARICDDEKGVQIRAARRVCL